MRLKLGLFAGLLLVLSIGEAHQRVVAQSTSHAQDSTAWRVEANTGYYTQEGTPDPGVGLFVNVGRELSTGFIGAFGFGIAQTYSRYTSQNPLFGDDRYYRTHYIFRLSFDYPFEVGARHRVLLGTGVVFVQRFWTRPQIRVRRVEGSQNVLIQGRSNPVTPNVAGLHFTVKYGYHFSWGTLGLRTDAHLFQFERGGEYIVAPFLAVNF